MRQPPERLEVTAVLDANPRYAGTSHDDATARAMGYRAALLPGVFVYGHVTRMAVQGWGEDWLARGRASVRFRRPVYHGDRLLIERGPLESVDDGVTADVSVTRIVDGEVVLDGSFGLPDEPPAAPEAPPLLPRTEPRLEVRAGGLPDGLRLGADETVLSEDIVAQSLQDFHETEPIYRRRGLIHSGCLLRQTMAHALSNLVLPMPVIFAAADVQNFALAPVGRRYSTSGRVTRVWERGGKHYFESEEWLIADGALVVARHLRRNLYAMDG
jgi:hypothetical protein